MINVRSVFEHVGECEPECNLHVLGSVWEVIGVLWGRVLWAVRGRVTNDHHDGTVRKHPLGNSEEVDAVIGDQICEIVLEREREKIADTVNKLLTIITKKFWAREMAGMGEIFKNNTSFDKILFNHRDRFFPSSSDFQINKIGPAGIWTGAIEYTPLPICRVNSWQLAGVCAWVCVNVSVCWSVCIYSAWAVASSVNLCTIECDTTWWREEPGALKWYVIMMALTPLFLTGLLPFSYLASFFTLLQLTCVFLSSHGGKCISGTPITPKDTSLRPYSPYDLEWTMSFHAQERDRKGSQWDQLLFLFSLF